MQSEILKREGEGQKAKKAGDRQRQIEGVFNITHFLVQMSCDWIEEVSKKAKCKRQWHHGEKK